MANGSCREVHNFLNASLQCSFIKGNAECQEFEGLVNYLNFVYCYFGNNLLPIFICCGWILILFIAMGTTADDFFCPALDVIAKFLKLSHNVAQGVTFLAFGNGAPDIFSSLAGVNQMKPDLVIGALFGGGLFVTCVVAGSIILVAPFDMMQRPFLRDVIFYLSAVFWTFYLFYNGQITLYHSVGFIALYVFYLIVVLVGHFVYQRWFKPVLVSGAIKKNSSIIITVASPSGSIICQNLDEITQEEEPYFWRRRSLERKLSNASSRSHRSHSQCSINSDVSSNDTLEVKPIFIADESTPLLKSTIDIPPDEIIDKISEWQRFLRCASPVDPEVWKELQIWQKILRVLAFPLTLLLKLTVPVVDHDKRDNNWCRSLVVLNCLFSPVIFSLWLGFGSINFFSIFPFWSLMLFFGCIMSLTILFTSSNDQPPVYHVVFAFTGFICSVIWIYGIANEIVSILKMIGVVTNLSDTILGLTILAWGNSLADLIADVSLAKQGLPKMGMSGCFGGPLFNLLLGIGIPFTLKIVQNPERIIRVQSYPSVTILFSFLCASLVSSLVVIPLMKFHTKRFYGVYLMTLYATFLLFSILNEVKVFGF